MANSVWIGWFGPSQGSSSGSGPSFPGTVSADRFLAGDGTAAAPSFAFTSETGLGWYRSATGVLSATRGTERVVSVNGSGFLINGEAGYGLGIGADVFLSRGAANLLQLAQDDNLSLVRGFIQGFEQTAPSAPAANGYRIFAVDNGGKTELMVLFQSGAAIQLAIEV